MQNKSEKKRKKIYLVGVTGT